MYKTEAICRLCLQISESDFEIIDEITKSILDALCLKDLSLGKEPGMCKNCATVLRKSFDLMSTCQNTKDCKSFSVNENANERCTNLNGSIINNTDYRACQFCTQIVKNGFHTSLNQLEEDLVAMKDVLPNCILDLYIIAVDEPVLCEFCHDSIKNHITFLKNWLQVEYKIKYYYEIGEIGSKDQIDLGEVLQYFLLPPDCGGKNLSLVNHDKSICQTENCITTMLQTKNEEFILPEHELKTETEVIDTTSGNSVAGKSQNMTNTAEKCSGSKNPSLKVYKCDKCAYETTRKRYFPVHSLIHRDIEIFECKSCPYKTKHKFHFERHPLAHRKYKCDICSFETKHRWYLSTHILLHKGSSETTIYKCEVCPYETKNRVNLKKHSLNHNNTYQYKCDTCSYMTHHLHCLRRHGLLHKSPLEVTMYKCEVCMYMTRHKKNFTSHVALHNVSKATMYQCKNCTYKTKSKCGLKSHMLVHKSRSEVSIYKCEKCSYKTKRDKNLKQHMIIHKKSSEVEMFKCYLCNYQTKRKCNLKQHVVVHSEANLYKCERCSFETRHQSTLKHHILKHAVTSEDTAEAQT